MRKRTSDSGTLLQNFRCYSHSSDFCSVSAVGKYCGNRKKWIWHIISLLSPSTFLSNQIQNCCVLNKKLIVVWQTYTFTFIPLSICFPEEDKSFSLLWRCVCIQAALPILLCTGLGDLIKTSLVQLFNNKYIMNNPPESGSAVRRPAAPWRHQFSLVINDIVILRVTAQSA